MLGTIVMAEGRRIQDQQMFEDSETTEPEIVDQFLPDDAVTPARCPAPPARQVIDPNFVNRLQGRPFVASCRLWQGTTGQMLAEIARALRLGAYELYSLEVTAEYVYGFIKMEGSR
jgi:hypothetical protein